LLKWLIKKIIGGFSDYNYWISSDYVSEDEDPLAWYQTFGDMFKNLSQSKNVKNAKGYVRSIRAFKPPSAFLTKSTFYYLNFLKLMK
jgi:hypothetical protein